VGAKAARRKLGIYYTPAESAQELVASTGWPGRPAGLLRCADAACGTGELLVAAWELAPAGAEVHCLGFEVDAVAAAVTRARLMLRRRARGLAWGAVAGWIVCADALTAPPPWPTDFELVVGNPPFGNAIEKETARTVAQTTLLRQRFPHAARGAFDRAAIFAELSLAWAGEGGCVALVLPRAMQSVAYADGLRDHWASTAQVSVVAPGEPVRFGGAQVAVSFWVARSVGQAAGPVRWVSDGLAWWEPWMQGWPAAWEALGTFVHLQSGATVSEAYGFAGLLTEGGAGFRFVTAGAIDPHRIRWGERQRYLGRDLHEPRLTAAAAGRRAAVYGHPKVCVPALSRVVEAAADERGELAAAVSVLVGWPKPERGLEELRRLALLLNTALIRLRYQTANAPQAMAGGSVPVSKQKLLALTVPAAWFGSQPPAELVPSGFAEQVAGLPALPAKRLATAAELAAFASAVRDLGAPPSVWEAAITAALGQTPVGGSLQPLQPLSDGCLLSYYLCVTEEDSA
jgi:predicted RNA methylase